MNIPKTCASNPLFDVIKSRIDRDGSITFHDYMHMALYEPGLGYYQQQETILGRYGDFVTAPELTSLFGKTLSRQILDIVQHLTPDFNLMEIGPGRGKLMLDLLTGLHEQNKCPKQTYLVETSESLIAQQQNTLKDLNSSITWLCEPQGAFEGIIIANELIDALPVHRVRMGKQPKEWYVTLDDKHNLRWHLDELSTSKLSQALDKLNATRESSWPEHYDTEINLNQERVLHKLSQCLSKGVVLFIDYGFDRNQYYLDERDQGTLMTHQAHRSDSDPLKEPGKKDITAHVDFTQLALDAIHHGFSLLGYTTQAHFLLSNGLLEELQKDHNLHNTHLIQTLVAPQEMGELFKVMALGKQFDKDLKGFELKDFSYSL